LILFGLTHFFRSANGYVVPYQVGLW